MADLRRRAFLGAMGAAAVAGGLADGAARAGAAQPEKGRAPSRGAPGQAAAPSKRTLRKAVMIGMVHEGKTVLEKFEILRECGFEGAELDSPSKTPSEEILAAQEKTGIKVHGLVDSLHWKLPLNSGEAAVREQAIDGLRTALEDGKRYGSTSVLLVPAVVNGEMPYDEAYRLSQAAIRTVLPLAAECGVKIGIENVWNNFLLSPLEAVRYIDEFESPWVGWHLDIGNVITYGWPEQWVRILGKRVIKLHIKDFSRGMRDSKGLWKGFEADLLDGDAGWPAVMKALDEVGYSTAPGGNWATAEVRGGDRARLKEIAEKMERILRG